MLPPALGSASCPVCRWQQPRHFGAYPSKPWPYCHVQGAGPALPSEGPQPHWHHWCCPGPTAASGHAAPGSGPCGVGRARYG